MHRRFRFGEREREVHAGSDGLRRLGKRNGRRRRGVRGLRASELPVLIAAPREDSAVERDGERVRRAGRDGAETFLQSQRLGQRNRLEMPQPELTRAVVAPGVESPSRVSASM